LNLANLFGGLCTVVGLATSVIPGHDLHELIGFLQVVRRASADEFLQLCRLGSTFLLLHLLSRSQIVRRVQDGSVLLFDSRERVALVAQQTVHVPDEAQILPVL
jgi:hypothetical protein